MYPITFRKDRTLYFLDCLINNRPILHDPDQPGWTVDKMLQLIGACFLTVAVHGPTGRPTPAQLQKWQEEHPEHREAQIETLMHDLHAAMKFVMQLTQIAYDGDYDQQYAALVRCGVHAVNTRIETEIISVEGFQGHDG